MRVVNRKAFLALPSGTVYAKGVQWAFDGICVKEDNSGCNDWYYRDFTWVEADNTGEAIDRLESMLNDGTASPMQYTIGRDGSFDDAAIFLIYDYDDLLMLRDYIERAVTLLK